MQLTSAPERAFREAVACSICQKPLDQSRVRDHTHITGIYRGAAQVSCNLNYKQLIKIPVIFPNLKDYDGHPLLTGIEKLKDDIIDAIPCTLEKYIAFKLYNAGSTPS